MAMLWRIAARRSAVPAVSDTLDQKNYSSSYASAAWDIRHNFTTAFNYDIPFGRGKQYGANINPVVNALIGGWALNGTLTLHTGQPFTVSSNGCIGVWNRCQPILVAGKDPNAAPGNGRTANQWFNTGNFLFPNTSYPGGNLGLQTNYGPPARALDFGLFKDFVCLLSDLIAIPRGCNQSDQYAAVWHTGCRSTGL